MEVSPEAVAVRWDCGGSAEAGTALAQLPRSAAPPRATLASTSRRVMSLSGEWVIRMSPVADRRSESPSPLSSKGLRAQRP
jgi:hypothetical protein